MEKIKQKSGEAFFGFTKRTFPRPPISTLGALQPSIVPEGTKVWRNGTCLTANSNIEIGAPGNLLLSKQKTLPTFSILFSPNIVLLQYGPPGVTFRCGLTPPAWSLPTPDGLRSVPGIASQSRVW